MFTRKLNSHKKPVGKAVLTGFKLEFNQAMNAATAGNATNYVVDWVSTVRVKKTTKKIYHPLPIRVLYSDSDHSVTLTLSKKQAFAKGGQITVTASAPNGVESAAGAFLDGNNQGVAGDNGVFTITTGGKRVTR